MHVPTSSSPTYLQLQRWELCPLENHNYPTCRVNYTEESAASEGWWAVFSSVKALVCISVFQPSLALLYRMTAGLCKRQQAPTLPQISNISMLWGSVSGIHYVFSPREEGRAGSSSTRWQKLLLPMLWSLKGPIASCPFQEARLAMPAEA